MLCAEATSTVRRKYAVSASSCRMPGELALGGREAHVDHVEALLDGPAETAEQRGPAAREAGAEHADARDLAARRERANDPGARRSVAAEVALFVLRDLDLVALEHRDCDRLLHLPDERMAPLDAAVEDADADVLAVEPPHAHSRVSCAGHSSGSWRSSARPAGRLQAGSGLLLTRLLRARGVRTGRRPPRSWPHGSRARRRASRRG